VASGLGCGTLNKEGIAVKKALITGITGQDGSYLAELLLAKGYELHGIIRRARQRCYWARMLQSFYQAVTKIADAPH